MTYTNPITLTPAERRFMRELLTSAASKVQHVHNGRTRVSDDLSVAVSEIAAVITMLGIDDREPAK